MATKKSKVTGVRLDNEARAYWEEYAERNGYKSAGECLRALLEAQADGRAVVLMLPKPAIIELEYRAKKKGKDLDDYLSMLLELFIEELPAKERVPQASPVASTTKKRK